MKIKRGLRQMAKYIHRKLNDLYYEEKPFYVMFDFVDINHIVYDKANQHRLFKY